MCHSAPTPPMNVVKVAMEPKAQELAAKYERYVGIFPKHLNYLHLTYLEKEKLEKRDTREKLLE